MFIPNGLLYYCSIGLVLLSLNALLICIAFNFEATQKPHQYQRQTIILPNAIAKLDLQKCDLTINERDALKMKNLTDVADATTDSAVERIASYDCKYVINYYSFEVNAMAFTEEEKNYPIAFSVLTHQNSQQLMYLLSQIYAPHNVYCVHLDAKAPAAILRTLKSVQHCFSNIRLATKREKVVYASYSRLQADINCMKDLLNSSVPWVHLMNIAGQDFPTKTNLEIVRKLKKLNGTNVIPGDAFPTKHYLKRTKYVHRVSNITNEDNTTVEKITITSQLKLPPPFNITIRKNLAYNVFTRKFLNWALKKSAKGKALLEWSRDTRTPDEHYWLMLEALEQAPGRRENICWQGITPFVKWRSKKSDCGGYWRHSSCVFGTSDLPQLVKQGRLFANKFDIQFDAKPIVCLRKWLKEKKRLEFVT